MEQNPKQLKKTKKRKRVSNSESDDAEEYRKSLISELSMLQEQTIRSPKRRKSLKRETRTPQRDIRAMTPSRIKREIKTPSRELPVSIKSIKKEMRTPGNTESSDDSSESVASGSDGQANSFRIRSLKLEKSSETTNSDSGIKTPSKTSTSSPPSKHKSSRQDSKKKLSCESDSSVHERSEVIKRKKRNKGNDSKEIPRENSVTHRIKRELKTPNRELSAVMVNLKRGTKTRTRSSSEESNSSFKSDSVVNFRIRTLKENKIKSIKNKKRQEEVSETEDSSHESEKEKRKVSVKKVGSKQHTEANKFYSKSDEASSLDSEPEVIQKNPVRQKKRTSESNDSKVKTKQKKQENLNTSQKSGGSHSNSGQQVRKKSGVSTTQNKSLEMQDDDDSDSSSTEVQRKRDEKEVKRIEEKIQHQNKANILQNITFTPKKPLDYLKELYPNMQKVNLKADINIANADIYLLKVPKTIDANILLNTTINPSKINKIKADNKKYILEGTDKTPDSKLLILSNRKQAIDLQSTIFLKKYLKSTKIPKIEMPENSIVPFPSSLKERHPLFGSDFEEKTRLNEIIQEQLDQAKLNKIKEESKRKKLKKKNKEEEKSEVIFDLLLGSSTLKKRKRKTENDDIDDSAYSSSGHHNPSDSLTNSLNQVKTEISQKKKKHKKDKYIE